MPSNAFSAEISEDQFRERQMKAGRSGNPAWLWPEVPVDEWVQATRHITEAVSSMLNGATGAVPPSDPKTFSLACYTSGVGPLLGYWVEQGRLRALLPATFGYQAPFSLILRRGRSREPLIQNFRDLLRTQPGKP